ncbi:MAG: outer membrane beta-barrel protein [Bacteroidota bacterium]
MSNKKYLLLLLLWLMISLTASAQTFSAGIIAGLNLSQIDGDSQTGYDKPGLVIGAKAIVKLNSRLSAVIELLLNQKGAAFDINPAIPNENYVINLNYMEVPALLDLHFGRVSDKHFKHHLLAGVGYGRLFSANFKEGDAPFTFKKFEPDFRKNEISPIFGYSFFFTPNIGVDFRYSFAVTRLYERVGDVPTSDITRTEFLRNYYLSVRGTYVF